MLLVLPTESPWSRVANVDTNWKSSAVKKLNETFSRDKEVSKKSLLKFCEFTKFKLFMVYSNIIIIFLELL